LYTLLSDCPLYDMILERNPAVGKMLNQLRPDKL